MLTQNSDLTRESVSPYMHPYQCTCSLICLTVQHSTPALLLVGNEHTRFLHVTSGPADFPSS